MSRLRLMTVSIIVALPLLAFAANSSADTPADYDPLFQSHELLELEIVGPITTLTRKRPDDEDLPATANWTEGDGRNIEVSVGLRTRGNYRRDKKNCSFPPVRLNFRTSELDGTVFEKQDKLKLVTHCQDRSDRYEQTVVREYLVYRMLNALTDLSYQARLARITYTDTESKRHRTTYAILIEHKERFSKRTDLPIVEIPRAAPSELNPAYTNLISMFQYFVANVDFSPIAGAEGENCCHNVNLFGHVGSDLYTVAYDFDITGMVNAPHATPNPRFGLRNVRQRLYRGRCWNNQHIAASIQTFIAAKTALFALVDEEEQLSKSTRKTMNYYVNAFFKIVEDPKAVDKRIIRRCVGSH